MIADPKELYRYSQAVEPLPHPDALTEAHVEAYHRDGFIAIENVLTPEEVVTARTALGDLIHGRVAGYDGVQPEPEVADRWPSMSVDERADTVRKVWLFVEHEARLKALATEQPLIQSLLRRLLGEDCQLIQDMALLKPPFIGTEKPWHQDAAYFGWGPPERIIGLWIALDHATAENGCMHVVPGTHRAGPVPHVHRRDCQIPDENVEIERDVIVPLAPGGAMIFSSLIHHGTPPNQSATRRWAIQYHYAGVSCERLDKRAHAALYFEDENYAGCRGKTGQPLAEIEG